MGILSIRGRDIPGLAEGDQPHIPPALVQHHHRQALAEGSRRAVGRHIDQATSDDEPHQTAVVRCARQANMTYLANQILCGNQAIAVAHGQSRTPEQQESHQKGSEGEANKKGEDQGSQRE
jgi:hypothetical protein